MGLTSKRDTKLGGYGRCASLEIVGGVVINMIKMHSTKLMGIKPE